MPRLSSRAYAKTRGVTEAAIRKAIGAGLIIRGDDGLVDQAQADAAWLRLHMRRRGQAPATGQNGVVLADARLQWARARLATETSVLADLSDSLLERAEVERVVGGDATDLLAQLADIPAKYRAWLGEVSSRAARRILTRLIGLILEELGDIHEQALAIIRRTR
jgi:hypothetical protein